MRAPARPIVRTRWHDVRRCDRENLLNRIYQKQTKEEV